MSGIELTTNQRAKAEAMRRLNDNSSVIFVSGNEVIAIEARQHVASGHYIGKVVKATVDGKDNEKLLNMNSEDSIKMYADLLRNYPEQAKERKEKVSDTRILIMQKENKNTESIGYIEKANDRIDSREKLLKEHLARGEDRKPSSILFSIGTEKIGIEITPHILSDSKELFSTINIDGLESQPVTARFIVASIDGKSDKDILKMDSNHTLKIGMELLNRFPKYSSYNAGEKFSEDKLEALSEKNSKIVDVSYIKGIQDNIAVGKIKERLKIKPKFS